MGWVYNYVVAEKLLHLLNKQKKNHSNMIAGQASKVDLFLSVNLFAVNNLPSNGKTVC